MEVEVGKNKKLKPSAIARTYYMCTVHGPVEANKVLTVSFSVFGATLVIALETDHRGDDHQERQQQDSTPCHHTYKPCLLVE